MLGRIKILWVYEMLTVTKESQLYSGRKLLPGSGNFLFSIKNYG